MKKVKRIMAMIGVILLICMYGATLVVAIVMPEGNMNMLMASLAATIIIPVLLWAYSFVYRLVKPEEKDEPDEAGDTDNTDNTDNL